MALLLLILALGYLLAAFLVQFAIPRVLPRKKGVVAAGTLLVVLVGGLVLLSMMAYFNPMEFNVFRETGLFGSAPPALSIVLNMAVSLTHQVGLVLIFALLSVPLLFKGPHMRTETLYLAALPIAFVPLLGSLLYVSMVLSPFIAILGTLWFLKVGKSARSRLAIYFILALVIASSLALPVWSTHRWNSTEYLSGETVDVPDQVFNDANYMRWQTRDLPTISNVYVMAAELAAASGNAFLGSGIQMVLNGDVTYADIQRNVTWSKSPFPRNLYVWFEYQNEEFVAQNIMALMIIGVVYVETPQTHYHGAIYYSSHPKLVVAVDNLWPTHYVDQYSIIKSNFLLELQRSTGMDRQEFSSYKSYQSECNTFYLVQLPL
jgi:hypothetical protein